jgi:hypothetical protein
MGIGRICEGIRPFVEIHKGEVAVWGGEGDDTSGLIIGAGAAIETAFAILKAASQIINGPILPNSASIEVGTPANVSEDHAARIVVTLENAPVAIDLGAAQFVDLAAALAAIAREIG